MQGENPRANYYKNRREMNKSKQDAILKLQWKDFIETTIKVGEKPK
jgi:hypothetical protein